MSSVYTDVELMGHSTHLAALVSIVKEVFESEPSCMRACQAQDVFLNFFCSFHCLCNTQSLRVERKVNGMGLDTVCQWNGTRYIKSVK
jgi:hypothetical protein